jgi:mannose-6-phosphate isomerase-like protein (cupin superfamily)
MTPGVRFARDADEFATRERCCILEVANDAADPAASIARARVAPGVTTEWHRLDGVDERYVLLEGRGRVELGRDFVQDVGPGDVVRVPAGVAQRISNTGAGDLLFYCVCTPRFTPGCYTALTEEEAERP